MNLFPNYLPAVLVLTAMATGMADGTRTSAQARPLESELREMLKTHPRLLAARKNIKSAQHGIRAARSGYFPTVDVSGDIGREYIDSPSRRSSQDNDFHDTARSTTLTITQNLFEGFRTGRQTRIAELRKDVVEESYRIAEQSLLFDGIRAYVNLLKQSRLLEIAKQNEQTLQEQLDLESARVERGSGLTVDVLQAKSRLQLARERVVTILGDLRQAHSVYREIFGRAAVPAQMARPPVPAGLIPETVEGAVAVASDESSVLKRSNNAVEIAS